MRIVPAHCALMLLAVATATGAQEHVALVATTAVSPTVYEVTLPEKVGVLLAGEHRVLAFEVAGRLAHLAEEGQPVSRGELVAQLDADLERARLRRAELLLREARSDQARVLHLRESQVVSPKELEAAETALGLRLAEADAAREQLERKRLVAQFEGVVVERFLDPGEVARPAVPIATLMKLDPLRLELGVPGYQIGRIVPRARAVVSVAAYPNERFAGVVRKVAPAAAEGSHLFEVEITVPNPEVRLRPGMSARAGIVTETLDQVLPIPIEAVVERDGNRVAFFVGEGRARQVPLDDAPIHGDAFLLQRQIPFRELVVRGQRDLRDGDIVRVDNSVLGSPATP